MSTRSTLLSFTLAVLAAPAFAQIQKTLPAGMDFVEGPLVYTYPFGRQTGAMQLLYDGNVISSSPRLITGIRFRQSQVTAAQAYPSYTQDYTVTMWTVSTPAVSMVADPTINNGGAPGTVVFQGPLTLPAVAPLAVQPAGFDIAIPLTTPYLFDPSQGGLQIVIETNAAVAPPSGLYRIDAVNFAYAAVTGLSTNIDTHGCTSPAGSLTLAVDSASAIVGGSLVQNVTSSNNGAFPAILCAVDFQGMQTSLAPFGMPGCTAWVVAPITRFALENLAGGYSPIVWTLPATPILEGVGLVSQVLGLPASGLTSDMVTSNGYGTRVGGATGPTRNMNMSFRATSAWSMGTNGVFVAVAKLEMQ